MHFSSRGGKNAEYQHMLGMMTPRKPTMLLYLQTDEIILLNFCCYYFIIKKGIFWNSFFFLWCFRKSNLLFL